MSDPRDQITPSEVMFRLDQMSREMDSCSSALNLIERELETVEAAYQEFVDSYEIGLYQRSIEQDGYRLPSEALRLKLANRAMDPELFGRRTALVKKRDRGLRRIATLKVGIDAQRSILSALKAEVEATR